MVVVFNIINARQLKNKQNMLEQGRINMSKQQEYEIKEKGNGTFTKVFVAGCTLFTVGYCISKLNKFSNEVTKRKSADGPKEYYTTFGSNEFRPGRTFKSGEVRALCSAVTFNIGDLCKTKDIVINVNAVMSAMNFIVPKGYKVVISDVSKCVAVADLTDRAGDKEEEPVIKVYLSGFMSAVCFRN